jgi:hypothetical protein
MSPSEAIKLIIIKAAEAPYPYSECGKNATLYWAAWELWRAEYASWEAAAQALGVNSGAALCAWERRSAYAELSNVLREIW